LAAAIEKRFGVPPALIEGSGGVFDVTANGNLIFSKHQAGRFPEEHEVLDVLASAKR
jgi:selenoprotein W-related protein